MARQDQIGHGRGFVHERAEAHNVRRLLNRPLETGRRRHSENWIRLVEMQDALRLVFKFTGQGHQALRPDDLSVGDAREIGRCYELHAAGPSDVPNKDIEPMDSGQDICGVCLSRRQTPADG